jgi:hypothetical protein
MSNYKYMQTMRRSSFMAFALFALYCLYVTLLRQANEHNLLLPKYHYHPELFS